MDPNDWTLFGNAGTTQSPPNPNFLGTTDNQPLVIMTHGVEALRIDTGGNVGIGTTTPPHRLSVVANFDGDGIELIGSQSQTKDVGVALIDEVGNVGNLGLASAPNAFMTGVSPGDIVLQSVKGSVWLGAGGATATPTLGIFSDGHLSIGRDSGISEVPASPNVETAEILRLTRPAVSGKKNSNSMGLFLGAFEPGISGRSRLDINVSGTPDDSNGFGGRPDVTVMSLFGDGNVSIGTTSPNCKLTVVGTE